LTGFWKKYSGKKLVKNPEIPVLLTLNILITI
jgi:hypothetical protein